MGTIKDLTTAAVIAGNDKFPLWSTAESADRSATLDMIAAYVNAAGTIALPALNFGTRAEAVAAIDALQDLPHGTTIFAGGMSYVRDFTAGFAIPDMEGFLPNGESDPKHFGVIDGEAPADATAAAAWIAYGSVLSAPTVLQYAIEPAVSGLAANAAANVAAINAAFAESASSGRTIRYKHGTIPINSRIIPGANADWKVESNATFLVQFHDDAGMFRSSLAYPEFTNCLIDGWTFEVDTDPGTGNPYASLGFLSHFTDCELHRIEVLNYWGRQGIFVGLTRTRVWYPKFWTEDPDVGTGGFRISAGRDSTVYGAKGRCGDDALQIVSSENGVFYNKDVQNIVFHGGQAHSEAGCAARILVNEFLTCKIVGCGHVGVTGTVGPQSVAAAGANSMSIGNLSSAGGIVDLCFMDSMSIDETLRVGTASAYAGGAYIHGAVKRSRIVGNIQNPDKNVARFNATAGLPPTQCKIDMTANAAPVTTTTQPCVIQGGIDNVLTFKGVAPAAAHAIYVTGGDRNVVEDCSVEGVQAGFAGVRVLTAATNTTVRNSDFSGVAGASSVSFQAAALAGDIVTQVNSNGRPLFNIGAATVFGNRA